MAVADEAYRFAEQLGDETGMARAILGMGNCNVKIGNYAIALEQLKSAYASLERLGEIKFASTALLNRFPCSDKTDKLVLESIISEVRIRGKVHLFE